MSVTIEQFDRLEKLYLDSIEHAGELQDLLGTELAATHLLKHQVGMLKISLEHKARLLESCETALAERDAQIDKLECSHG